MHSEEMEDFEEVLYLPNKKFIDTIAEGFENRFEKLKQELSHL